MTTQLTDLLKDVEQIVKDASVILRDSFTVEKKDSTANIVTSADINVQQFLKNKLCDLLPKSSFLAEEGTAKDITSEYVWIVDPIDGTTNFARGMPEYAISVGLIYQQTALLGVVYNPNRDTMFCATLGGGAMCNDYPIHVADTNFDSSIFCTAMSVYRKEFSSICMDIIKDTYHQCADIRRFGSCALELCYLANGTCDLFFEFHVFPWDYAGAYLILREAGGVIHGLEGEDLRFNKSTPIIAANSKENYNRLCQIVQKHIKELPYNEVFRQ